MAERTMGVEVLHYAQYLGPDSETVYTYRDFCGECRREIEGVFAKPKYPEDVGDVEVEIAKWYDDREYEHSAFCQWCGAQFEDEWWKGRPLQNERVPDHYRNPGTHAGDVHEFRGHPGGHVLSSSDGSLCWCEPEIEPGLMKCVVRHRDVERSDG